MNHDVPAEQLRPRLIVSAVLVWSYLSVDGGGPGEVLRYKHVAFAVAYLTFKTKAQSDKAWKMMRKDPFMVNFDPKTMPFDGSRMFWGSFKTLVQF